jgi:membrane-associated phospholipid phosphatase
MNIWWLIPAGAGLIVVALSVLAARRAVISAAESRVFHAINGLPDGLFPWLWVPMQLGNLVVGTAVGLMIALLARNLTAAIGVVVVMALKLVLERVVRREVADYLVVRQRPGTSQVGAILRGRDVPSSGPSFPSGHVILTSGVAMLVIPILPGAWWWAPVVLTASVTVGRVYVGAHNPLDVAAGLGTGVLLGSLVAALVD